MPGYCKGTVAPQAGNRRNHNNHKALVVARPVHSRGLLAKSHANLASIMSWFRRMNDAQRQAEEQLHPRDQVDSGKFWTPPRKIASQLRRPRRAASSTSGTSPQTKQYGLRRRVGTSQQVLTDLSPKAAKPN